MQNDPLRYFDPPAVIESMDDPLSCFRSESDATVLEFADDGDRVSGDTAEQKAILVAQASPESSTIDPIALEALREELKETQVIIKDSMAAASALRSEIGSLTALVTPIAAEFRWVQETARGATVEQSLGVTGSRLGPLGDLEDVRREIEERLHALNALAQDVRANTDAISRRQGRVEQLALETPAQLQQRKQRDVEFGHEMARSQSVGAFAESAWRRARELVDRLKAGWAADVIRSPGAGTHARRSLTIRNVAGCIQRGRTALKANVAAVLTVLALMSAFVLHSVWRTADLVDPSVVTAPVPSTAVPTSATSAITMSEGSFDSASTGQSLTRTRQAASINFETPATRRATEFVGTLSIRSTPGKAEVHIDRKRVGETPLVLQRLRAGSHAIWIDHEGYQRWTAGVNVRAGELTRVTTTLKAEPGR